MHSVSSIDHISTNTQYHIVISMFYQSPMHTLSLETGLCVHKQLFEKVSLFGLYHFCFDTGFTGIRYIPASIHSHAVISMLYESPSHLLSFDI